VEVKSLHQWDLSYAEARALQTKLAELVIDSGHLDIDSLSLVAGADVSYSKRTNRCYCAAVVLSFPQLLPISVETATVQASFPYIPGLLSFREMPGLVRAFEQLSVVPDVVLVDGQGLAHPRGMGLACHLGLLLDIPTIGCAKSRLVGEFEMPGAQRGQMSDLTLNGKRVGVVLRTRTNVAPVFVSVGHKIDLQSAARTVLACSPKFRLPETTRLAHRVVNEMRRSSEG